MPDGSAHKFGVLGQLKVDEWRALSDMPADVVRNIIAEGPTGFAIGAETTAFKALEGLEARVVDVNALTNGPVSYTHLTLPTIYSV